MTDEEIAEFCRLWNREADSFEIGMRWGKDKAWACGVANKLRARGHKLDLRNKGGGQMVKPAIGAEYELMTPGGARMTIGSGDADLAARQAMVMAQEFGVVARRLR